MIILSFGSGLDMESRDPAYIQQVADSVAYAHSKNISMGGYNLMSSSRTVAKGGNCVGPDGKPNGASCLASGWSDDYFATIKGFIEKTGFDMIETDGPYEGNTCDSATHDHHQGHGDSAWTQYERNMDFYAWCRSRGMYIHAPDPFYMRGINKDGMGYVETNWNLPLWEQINLARQNVYVKHVKHVVQTRRPNTSKRTVTPTQSVGDVLDSFAHLHAVRPVVVRCACVGVRCACRHG